MSNYEVEHGEYLISDDPARLDIDVVHAFLSQDSYWTADPKTYDEAPARPEAVRQS